MFNKKRLLGETMYRFLIIVIFNSVAINAVLPKYRPQPPYDTFRSLQKHQTAMVVFAKIAQEHPEIDLNSYKYQWGDRGWGQNFTLYFISNEDGTIERTFVYNRETKQLEK